MLPSDSGGKDVRVRHGPADPDGTKPYDAVVLQSGVQGGTNRVMLYAEPTEMERQQA